MIKTFEQFNISAQINESIDMYDPDHSFISAESSYWQKAINFFKAETGKDLTSFKWAFEDNNIDNSIIPQNYVVALMTNSPVTSKYKGMIDYIKNFLSSGNMSYYSGRIGKDFVLHASNSLQNSAALYKIWVDYFYIPIKNAIQTKNFDSISMTGMEPFEERMSIFSMDFDSDWEQFFSTIRLGLQPVEAETAQPVTTMPQQKSASTQQAQNKPRSGGAKPNASYSLPTSFK